MALAWRKVKGREDAFAARQERIEALRMEFADISSEWSFDAVTLEIGCGHGHYLAAYAASHTDTLCLGADLLTQRVVKANAKAKRGGLQNLVVLKAEATELLEALPEALWPKRVFLLFLDPWPKKRHHKKRLIQHEFLKQLQSKTLPNARLHFRTDHEDYFRWAMEHLRESSCWEVQDELAWPFESSSFFQDLLGDYQSLTAVRVD